MKNARRVWVLATLVLFNSGPAWPADEPKLQRELTLKEAVEEALKKNPEIQAARMKLAAGNARSKQAP
jgi:outer membrane protein TolC